MKKYWVIGFCLLYSLNSFSQNEWTVFFEPEINIEYMVAEKYFHSFSVENRNFIYKNNKLHFDTKHIEIVHFSEYIYKPEHRLGLGVQYRFEKAFKKTEEDEIRVLQQYTWANNYTSFKLKNRFRNEQRFYRSETKFRIRYEVGFTFYTTEEASYFKTETETLLEWSAFQKPEFEARVTGVFGWQLGNSNLEIGLQYRMLDISQQLGYELFLVTGLDISL